jgi:AcrR family transcriptional regulator
MTGDKRIRLTREASQAQTRQRLLESAARLIARHGIDISVRDICDGAGYSPGALYANFDSKELLFLELLRQHMERNVRELQALPAPSARASGDLLARLDAWLSTLNSDRDWSALSVELQIHASRDASFAAHYDRLFSRHRRSMATAVETLFSTSGREPPATPEDIANAIIALAHGHVLQRRRVRQGSADPAGHLIKLFIKGLLALSPQRASHPRS